GYISSELRNNSLSIENTNNDGNGIRLYHNFFDFHKGDSRVRITWDDLENSSNSYLKLPKIDNEVTETIATQEWVNDNAGGGTTPKEEKITGTRLTNASVSGSTPLDWDSYKVFEFTLTGATTLTDLN